MLLLLLLNLCLRLWGLILRVTTKVELTSEGKRAGQVGVSRTHLRMHALDVKPASAMPTWLSMRSLTDTMKLPCGMESRGDKNCAVHQW